MLKYIFLSLVGLGSCFSVNAIETHRISVLFETDKHKLTVEAQRLLESFVQNMDPSLDYGIYLEGHTDDVGQLRYNDSLSVKRAMAVKRYLLASGIEEKFIEAASYGERKPYRPNFNDQNRELNRRVEVTLTVYTFDSVEELEAVLGSESVSQTLIDPTVRNQVKGKDGVHLLIEPHAFLDENGQLVNDDVVVTVTEALEIEQFIGHSLATQSGNQMLVSGGMLKLTAQTPDGKTLILNKEKPVQAAVTTPALEKGMQLFTSETGGDWTLNNRSVSTVFNLDMSPAPIFNYMRYELPVYKRNMKTKPEEPLKQSKPRPPRSPDPLDYQADIKWYQWPFRARIKRKAKENYDKAVFRYQDKLDLYERRYKLYVEHSDAYPRAMLKYKADLKAWNEQCVQDSLDLLNSDEYLNLINSNKLLYQKGVAAYEKKMEEWRAKRRLKLDSITDKMDELGVSSETVVNTYMTTMTELSWINIDRFYKMSPEQTRWVTVRDKDNAHERVFLVFKDLKSMLPLYTIKEGKVYERDGFPLKEKVGILAYKVVNGKTMVYYEELSPKRDNYQMSYKPYTFREFKALLNNIQG